MTTLLIIIIWLYASVGIIATIGYIPIVKDLINHKKSANPISYIFFTYCSAMTFIYSITMFSDWLLQIVNGLNFACCTTILTLIITLNHKEKTRKSK